jgi:hypothetical protein
MERCAAFESEQTPSEGDQGDTFPGLEKLVNPKIINKSAWKSP